MADFTPTQGRYLAFIAAYTDRYGCQPAESDIAAAMCVSAPSVNQMVKMLEKKGLIRRQPGQSRTIEVLVPDDEIPAWGKKAKSPASRRGPLRRASVAAAAPATAGSLYVLAVYLVGGPVSDKFANKECSRVIEIRGDQTLAQLHQAIFKAYDRWDEHLYEFQFGKRPFDSDGPVYGLPDPAPANKRPGDARSAKLDDLDLKPNRVFGYWFDFGDDWYHQIRVDRIGQAIPTVTYPRVIRRVGKSPPQYCE